MREKITSLTFGTFPLKNKTKNEGEGVRTLASTKLLGPEPSPFDHSGTPSINLFISG
jgi:hypothetical protein